MYNPYSGGGKIVYLKEQKEKCEVFAAVNMNNVVFWDVALFRQDL
jgi:hypothetical protein